MRRALPYAIPLLLAVVAVAAPAAADEPADAAASPAAADESVEAAASPAAADEPAEEGDKLLSGTSIVGNDEAPKSLVIVPWKSSALGDLLDVSRALDDGRGPVDREVFTRQLTYYQIRSGSADRRGPAAR